MVVGRTPKREVVIVAASGARLVLSLDEARWVRDELARVIQADAVEAARSLSPSDFRVE